jgi:hypothetical protein
MFFGDIQPTIFISELESVRYNMYTNVHLISCGTHTKSVIGPLGPLLPTPIPARLEADNFGQRPGASIGQR